MLGPRYRYQVLVPGSGTVTTPSLVSYMMTLAQHIPCHTVFLLSVYILKFLCEAGDLRHDLYEYGYAASGIQKHYSPNKFDFPKRHAGGGSETKD